MDFDVKATLGAFYFLLMGMSIWWGLVAIQVAEILANAIKSRREGTGDGD
jgi:hypothetical protein